MLCDEPRNARNHGTHGEHFRRSEPCRLPKIELLKRVSAVRICPGAQRVIAGHRPETASVVPVAGASSSEMVSEPPVSVTPRPFPPGDLDDLQADLDAEITYRRHLVPVRPPRSYLRSQKRAGGRFPTKRPGDRSARRPRTKVVFWTLSQRS